MRVLGSITFTFVLIGLTLLFVIAGTFLESWSGSHLYASTFTYGSPAFHLLLAGYFVNILVSTVLRYPFQKRHIPFLITHLGLLLLLTGVFCKSLFGVQGSMGLIEGSGSHQIFLPNTHALLVEDNKKQILFPLKKEMQAEDLSITLLDWSDHVEERFEGFIKGEWCHLMGLPPFAVGGPPIETPNYTLYAVKGNPDSFSFPGKAALFFVQDEEKKEHLLGFHPSGERFIHTFDNKSFLIFNKGYGGYGVFAELPLHFPQVELTAPLSHLFTTLPPNRKKEDLKPLIRLLIKEKEQAEVITLAYDRFGTGFKWPALHGKYLLRFQSFEKTIPHHVRLREARKIDYPGTDQPYSFEADLLVDGEEATISMNHVFEKKGYRFYLANLLTAPFSAKRVQIVVNYDPAKYLLTYPGAILLAIGMILLYIQRRYV